MSVFQFLKIYISQVKWLICAVILVILGGEVCRQISFYYASRIPEILAQEQEKALLIEKALNMLALFCFFSFLRALIFNQRGRINAYYIPYLRMKITRDLFRRVQLHSLQFFTEEMSGRVAARLNNVVSLFFDLQHTIEVPVTTAIRIGIAFLFLSQIHLLMGVVLLLFLILYFYFLSFFAPKLVAISEVTSALSSLVSGFFVDTIFNHNLIKNDGNMGWEKRCFFRHIKKAVYAERKEYVAEYMMAFWQGVIRGLMQMSFVALPFYYWLNNEISMADFILSESLVTYVIQFGLNISEKVTAICKDWGGIQDGLHFLFTPISVKDLKKPETIKIKEGDISFQNVTFSYYPHKNVKMKKPVFQDFNLHIKAGDKVGLVGSSGSGKSSLIKLISRYYDIQQGSICIDGQNIANIKQSELHSQIAVIEQNPSLFNRSIRENIRYGNLNATDTMIEDVAKKAHIHDFIMSLEKGYDTVIGERGVILSGGERQRIAIARAILKDAPILILDEATSALDSESEIYIQESLKEVMQNRTVIAIAHRLSTLRQMDYLLVMQNGEIVERGAHSSLLKEKGVYAHFYQLQTRHFRRR